MGPVLRASLDHVPATLFVLRHCCRKLIHPLPEVLPAPSQGVKKEMGLSIFLINFSNTDIVKGNLILDTTFDAMLSGALHSHESFALRFVASIGNNLFNNEVAIDPGFDAFPNGKYPNHIPFSSFSP